MPPAMRTHLKNAWRQIAERTGARFNMAFWDDNEPRRSTYPACRAVIAAGRQLPGMVPAMIEGIQRAYYLHARNPSDLDTLVDVAGAVGLDTERFTADLESDIVRVLFERDREDAVAMGVEGFPSVIARDERGNHWITRGWCDPQNLIARWDAFASA